MEKADRLRELFRAHKALNHRVGGQPDGMNGREKTEWILNPCRSRSQGMAGFTGSVRCTWRADCRKFGGHDSRPT